jgi:hypothetical protein
LKGIEPKEGRDDDESCQLEGIILIEEGTEEAKENG